VPGKEGKYFWIGIHPVLLKTEKLHKILDSYNFDDDEEEEEKEGEEEEDYAQPFDNEALSIAFLKICEFLWEFTECLSDDATADMKRKDMATLCFAPGFILAGLRDPTTDDIPFISQPTSKDVKTGETKSLPWLIPYQPDDEISANFVFIESALYDSQIVRTSGWLISTQHDEVVKALIDAAMMHVNLIRATSFTLNDAALPAVYIEPIVDTSLLSKDILSEEDKAESKRKLDHTFTIAWILSHSSPKEQFTKRQRAIADMVFLKEAIVAPEGSVIDRDTETVTLPKEFAEKLNLS